MKNKKDGKEKKENSALNREIAWVAYVFIGLFVLLIGYFAYFLAGDNTELLSNPYNKRQDLLAERVERGRILGSGGEVLAETKVDKEGNEVRVYPYDSLFSHVVGRLNKGKTGIEESHNVPLLSSNRNPLSLLINELRGNKNKGDDVRTTLDVDLQKKASDALGDRKGAVVVMEPDTGRILAMVSKPDYNPNTIDEKWESILKEDDTDSVLLNRAAQGLYPPGSTFKILSSMAFMGEDGKHPDFHYDCKGTIRVDGMKINCYNHNRHGNLDLSTAFAKSCNGAFVEVGMSVGAEKIRETCNNMLFNVELPIPFEYNKSSFTLDQSSEDTEVAQTAIGQGKTMVSPLHNALIVAAIANAGVLKKPYVVERVENRDQDVVWQASSEEAVKLMGKKKANALYAMMRETVNAGTASSLRSTAYEAAGKTGSAEIASGRRAHAWFVGAAKKGKKKIVVSVIVEEVGTGSDYAVPIAKRIMDANFS